jgi:hypothetical protein
MDRRLTLQQGERMMALESVARGGAGEQADGRRRQGGGSGGGAMATVAGPRRQLAGTPSPLHAAGSLLRASRARKAAEAQPLCMPEVCTCRKAATGARSGCAIHTLG